MLKKPSVFFVLIAAVALVVGLLVYLFDRQPEHVYFLSHGLVLAHGQYSLFGVAGNYLPAFLHVYAFILFTVAVAGSSNSPLIRICTVWFVIALLFEFAQYPAVSPFIAAALPAWFARVPVLDNTAAYFLRGTFDPLDFLSIALGTVAAYLTVAITHKAFRATVEKGQNKVLRHGAITGVTVLGLLAIVASGDGDSTPDTTLPIISSTSPANAATGVFVDGSIRITFSEPMDPATVNPTTFMLEDANHAPVLTSVSYAGDIVTFTPVSPQPLARNTVYTATITTGAKDLAGNAITADHSWSFTTETDAWETTNVSGAPAGRTKHTAVWTGSEMIIWGGQDSGGVTSSGGHYDPVANTWSATATSNAPTPRLAHTAVWSGTQMIVWGGVDGVPNYFSDGAVYDPGTKTWIPIATPSGFVGRWDHTAVWTGTEMIVWGGRTSLGFSNTGAAYDPAMNSWRLLPLSTLLGSAEHTAVWTGTEMVVWGGNTSLGFSNTGAAYNPATNGWRPITVPPTTFFGRSDHSAVWTGSEMIVWGGNTNAGVANTGAAYDPATDTWRLISTTGAPAPRLDHTAVWTGPMGIAMVVWGGDDFITDLDDGGRYDPVTDSWKATDQTINVPTGRFDHTAIWTGSKMIVWGGNDGTLTNTGGRYTP